ncbi:MULTISPECIES: hypothetical protein [unclassified Neisseria]|uniref:hypothetical protein n=1 Tax=unclassified Neisseria TaxID=2623750 RepID=UPI00266647A8|nr:MULTISPECIES: hypothetical protein [unclassified Neisseria]MDO1509563.1 hypothetical protein [Neisseria sp. MVDL19-042950]MDO1515665.1 hypothetical protein [Neisseria sp. MVDL18-041461]MDO1563512.1 hypothetical protein [Neisseria sp. MVDL20-010259]
MEFLKQSNNRRSRQPCHADGAETESHRTDIADSRRARQGAPPAKDALPIGKNADTP